MRRVWGWSAAAERKLEARPMNGRDWSERRKMQAARIATGYTHARISRATAAELKKLMKELGYQCSGADELIYELVTYQLADPSRVKKLRK